MKTNQPTTKLNSIEEVLRMIHARENPEVLDDDLPDNFDNWLSELEQDELLSYCQEALTKIQRETREETIEEISGNLIDLIGQMLLSEVEDLKDLRKLRKYYLNVIKGDK